MATTLRKHTRYECARCGKLHGQLSHYKEHAARKCLCEAAKRDVLPTLENVIVHTVRNSKQITMVAQGGGMDMATSSRTTSNMTTDSNTADNNNMTNITYNTVNFTPEPKTIKQFPFQDLSHLPRAEMERIARLAGEDGRFPEGVREMFKFVYFDPAQPHNMNVFILPADDKAFVYHRGTWMPMDRSLAVSRMIEEQGDFIRNLSDEDGISVAPGAMENIEAAYIEETYVNDATTRKCVEDLSARASQKWEHFVKAVAALADQSNSTNSVH